MPGYVKPPVNGRVNGTMEMIPSLATQTPLTIKGAVSQTANLLNIQNSAGTTIASIDSSGRKILPNQPSFLAYKNSTWETVSGPVIFNLTAHNIGNNYSTSNGRFTAPVNGLYIFHFVFYVGGQTKSMAFKKNGSDYILADTYVYYDDAQATSTVTHTVMTYLVAGDYMSCGPRTTGTQYIYGQHAFFSGCLIG